MAYDFNNFKNRVGEIKEWLSTEFSSLRTGQATPALFDQISIDSYGAKQPIKHVAAISVEGPKTLRIVPWDKSQIKDIESAISASNLGVSTTPDNEGVRVIFPDLTEERRKMLAKVVGEKLEKAKVSLRQEREKVIDDLNKKKKEGDLSEDDLFRYKEELQKLVDATAKELEAAASKKEEEVMK